MAEEDRRNGGAAMSEHYCQTCGKFKYNDRHVCQPLFECRFADTKNYGDDWRQVREIDAENAAETFAEEFDCENEYEILKQGDRCEEIVQVRDQSLQLTRWRITAESRPHYYAEQDLDDDQEEILDDTAVERSRD